jgi:chromosome segregation protein
LRLAKLQINGFKSFHDRAELGFDRGVTAIVGPNGCGKSNVVDAITWVLGEQSAKSLRGERMEDVIFNGSDARKPSATAEVRLGLADVAQAAMPDAPIVSARGPGGPEGLGGDDPLLDDQVIATRDVEIGRRLYRSGESEYLIDGEVCRLRDIHDLLMDSGLGVKAYAVIEQGKIGQILSSRPAERRNLIEEAAGVTKYKSRRRSAELKLEAARQNLTRIDDIIFEVEKQRGALKRQAARARRYKRLRDELRRWEQVQFAHRHLVLSRQIEAADAQLAGGRAHEAAAAAHVAELETRLEAVRLELAEAESRATGAREETHARELEIGRRQQQLQFDRQQVDELGLRSEALGVETEELAGRRVPARAAIESQRDALARARDLLAESAGRVEGCEREYAEALSVVQRAERDADETRAAVLASTTTLSALRQARDNAGEVRDRVAAERSRLDIEGRDLQHEADRSKAARETAASGLAAARVALDAAVGRRKELEDQLTDQRARRDALGETLAARQRELAGHEARIHSLEEMDSRRASFGDAARQVLADTSALVRHHGALADHLDVEPSYERAVDALLGELLQYVLVEGHDDVDRALAHLASTRAGRCGFVVLEEERRWTQVQLTAELNGAVSLRHVVRAKGPHAAAVLALLPDALIVDSFDAGRQLARTAGMLVATRAGDVFRAPGVVEGGARGASDDARGILEMRGEIKRRHEELAQVGEVAHGLANQVFEIDRHIATAETELAERVHEQHTHEKAIVGLDGQLTRYEDDLARLERRLQVVDTERRRASEEEQSAERRREDAVATIAEYEAQQRGAEGKLGDVMSALQTCREDAESKMRLVTDARTNQAGLSERAAALENEVTRLEESARDLDERILAHQQEIERTETRRGELRAAIAHSEQRFDEDVASLESLKSHVRDADETVISRRGLFADYEHEIRAARHALEGARAAVSKLDVARATAAAELTHLASACLEAINAAIEDVLVEVERMEAAGELVAPAKRLAAMAEQDEDEGDGEEESQPIGTPAFDSAQAAPSDSRGAEPVTPDEVIVDLRRKVERLGPVNMMAIEQFDELETRHTFLTSQRKDLLDSIAQTGDAIRKIEKTTRERFEEAFQAINTNFEGTFTTLFGGGRAGLVLINQENDTESGIDIIAQPPGKRLQNVQLLSGGEKALTAMALMFAIFKYRPSPFCLLDEIDAPLDDANIGRFVEMLQGMQAHTQFILITHNRKTMEIANRLYGVTMEEPGVSKLISIQLN